MPTLTFAQALDEAVVGLTAEFTMLNRGGMDLGEVFGFFFSCLADLAALGTQYLETPEAGKKRLILSALRRVYRRTNPDIPLLPEPFETMLESMLLTYALPAAYAVLVKRV